MRVAVGSDEKTNLTDTVIEYLQSKGIRVETFGALKVSDDPLWPKVALTVGREVADGKFDMGVLFCWTGTGISIAANKVPGIRAALCGDAETAAGARKWNDANILAMSLRATSETVAKEMIDAWLETPFSTDETDKKCLDVLRGYDTKKST